MAYNVSGNNAGILTMKTITTKLLSAFHAVVAIVRRSAELQQRCVDCGETMQKTDQPVEHSLLIGNTELVIRRWEQVNFCNECAFEKQREQERRIGDSAFDAGFDKGYEKAYKDARHYA
jgi:hypothetical protein